MLPRLAIGRKGRGVFKRILYGLSGANLEIFKVRTSVLEPGLYCSELTYYQFGMYIMFPIGWMYYFGTNLESRFSVPDFWPAPESTHKIPHEREELLAELERLKNQRLQRRARRLELEAQAKEDK
ncbi:MAG: hypothetical protein L6R35_004514 [Caloplaca aegaea]|nr:MAG: hypothetical protein L6R35_004514 [Caloplaca aegaea]